MHKWERYGEMNEYPGVAWIEGPWVIKRNGIYYLEYSASGTQWKTYAEGYYTATSPLGPYTYAANNPLLQKTEGLVTGTAHGSIVKGPDDQWWQFYTIVLSNPPGGRRIGMDKVTFDADGLMYVNVTDIRGIDSTRLIGVVRGARVGEPAPSALLGELKTRVALLLGSDTLHGYGNQGDQ